MRRAENENNTDRNINHDIDDVIVADAVIILDTHIISPTSMPVETTPARDTSSITPSTTNTYTILNFHKNARSLSTGLAQEMPYTMILSQFEDQSQSMITSGQII
mmetsp:Transcript_12632/g.18985  ORF Transcript_12632/g.18985 Transcript_12632/m.18985 type:complete len:105 (+) Transcript_12632:499-813(+)